MRDGCSSKFYQFQFAPPENNDCTHCAQYSRLHIGKNKLEDQEMQKQRVIKAALEKEKAIQVVYRCTCIIMA